MIQRITCHTRFGLLQDEEGFAKPMCPQQYTPNPKQEVVGLPEGAMLVTLTIENEWYSTMAIEDLDIYVGKHLRLLLL